jgi:hypothetical protein
MQVTADLILKREATPQDAASFLAKVFDHTEQHLNGFQKMTQLFEGIVRQQGKEGACTPRQMADRMRYYLSEALPALVVGILSMCFARMMSFF